MFAANKSYIYLRVVLMKKLSIILMVILMVSGCANGKSTESYISGDNEYVSINYPVTNINVLDDAISSYVNKIYYNFKNMDSTDTPELNISYTYKEINNDIINVSLQTEIVTDKTINKIKTFTYNKHNDKFLTMEDLVQDLDGLDYEIKRELLEKYQDADMDYLSNVSYDFFTIDDENLTIYFNPAEIKSDRDELIYLDIPLDSLKLLIDIDKTEGSDTYLSIKRKNVSLDDKVVAITFDDGPSKYTEKILDILKKYDASGTFFLIGNKVEFYGDTLRRMLEEGSEIGNHSYDHKLLTRLSKEEFQAEINKTQEAIKKVTGFTPTLFRPTYGGYNNTLKSYTDLKFVLWDVDSRDWQVKTKDKILKNVLPNVKSGSIILLHDNHEYSLNSLDDILKNLKNQGYKFVTVTELLELKKLRESE